MNRADEIKAYKRFLAGGMTKAGACGLIANLEAESDGFYSTRVEYLCHQRLRGNNIKDASGKNYTDDTYTKAVDSGRITRVSFLNPLHGKQYGYGLAQWTSPSRKAGLYDLVKSKNVSIGDLDTQIDYLMSELKNNYTSVFSVLKTAKTIKEASDVVLVKFEAPADTGTAMKESRAKRGQAFYDDYAKNITGGINMTEKELRQKIVDVMNGWIGLDRAKGTHKPIIDLYNGHIPLARGYKVTLADAYCAATVSAAAIRCSLTDIIPTECSCGHQVALFQKLGRWKEDDAYAPQIGDIIYYYWSDNGIGDCTGWPDHVGMVVKVSGSVLTITEGNLKGKVAQREIKINARYIRGYGIPDYASKATPELQIKTGGKYKLTQNIYFRKAPAGEYVKYADLSKSAKTKSNSLQNGTKCKLKKGNTVQALEVKSKSDGNIWIRVKNGWLCVKYKGKYRIK